MKKEELPGLGEKVVVKIKNITPYGATAELTEYGNKEGFIHISQVSNSWIKNIRNFISEGSIKVAQVTKIDAAKNEIDISLRKVTAQQEKRKLTEWKREKRADKLFEKLCIDQKEKVDDVYSEIAIPLEDEYGDLMSAFEEIKINEEALKKFKFSKKWKDALKKFCDTMIVSAVITQFGDLVMELKSGDAIDKIKKILREAKKKDVQIEYISAPKYRLIAQGPDFKSVEAKLFEAANFCISSIEKEGGDGSFELAQPNKD